MMFGQRPQFSSGTGTFSGFGTNTNTQQSAGFGSNSTFGRSNTFGGQSTSTGFGATSSTATPFGSTATQGTSLFGSTAQPAGASTGLFGSNTTGGFGSTNTTGGGLFGTQNTAAAPSTGLFSSTSGNSNAFSAQQKPFSFATPTSSNTGGNLFSGSSGNSLFGSTAGTSNVVGTTVKYQPELGTDTMTRSGVTSNIQTRIEVITCMEVYKNKSLEELRVEDYLANRKGPGQGTTMMGGGAFGQTTNNTGTGGLFGSTNTAPASGGLFGQKPQENKPLFGTTGTGFGGASTSGGGLFGNTNNNATSAFGQPAASSAPNTGFSFGNQNNQQNKTGGGLFGQSQPSTGGFGTSNSGFSFGQNTATQSNLFNNQAKPAFGAATSTSGGGLFMNNNKPAGTPAFGGFNSGTTGFGTSSTSTPFGSNTNTNTGTGLFGNTQNKGGFGFGTTNTFGNTGSTFNTGSTGGGLFGNTATSNTGGIFSNTANQNKPAGGLNFSTGTSNLGFGLNTNAAKPNTFGTLGGGFGGTLGSTNNMLLGGTNNNNNAAPVAVGDNNIANLIKALTDNPFGHSSLLKTPVAASGKAEELLSPPAVSSSNSSSLQPPTYVLPSSIQPRPLPHASSPSLLNNRSLLFAGLDDSTDSSAANASEDIFKAKSYPSVKKLNLKVFNKLKGDASPQIIRENGSNSSVREETGSPLLPPNNGINESATPDIIKGRDNIKRLNLVHGVKKTSFNDTLADLNVGARVNLRNEAHDSPVRVPVSSGVNANTPSSPNLYPNLSIYDHSTASKDNSQVMPTSPAQPHPTGIKLARSGYYTIPSLSELCNFIDDNGQCLVENFTVGREGYGNVCFTSQTDVMGLDLDNIVFIVRKEVEVYPDSANKPCVGEGLNKAAVITLDAVWPIDKSSREVITDQQRLEAMGWSSYLEKKCLNMEAKFLEYRADTGSWVFKVNHFSKYGLQDDNDEFTAEDILKAQQQHAANASATRMADKAPKPLDTSAMESSMPPAAKVNKALDMEGVVSASNGLGGAFGPSSTGLVSHPPVASSQHLLPSSGASNQLDQVLNGVNRQSGVGGAAAVPAEVFLDSFAAEPEESASLGVPFPPSAANSVLNQLAANMFPQDEEDDYDDGRTTYMQDMDLTRGAETTSLIGSQEAPFQDVSAKKFAAKRLQLPSLAPSTPPAPAEGRLSVTAGELTVVRPKQLSSTASEGASSSPSVYRKARCQYPSLLSGASQPSHPSVVKPSANISCMVPLASSALRGQQSSILDMGAFMGHSNRVGWGPSLRIVHGGNTSLSTQVDIANVPSASQKSSASSSNSTAAPYLFLPSSGAPLLSSQPSHTAVELPKYSVNVERLHLAELSGSDSSVSSPANTQRTMEVCLEEVLQFCQKQRGQFTPATLQMVPEKGRDLLHRVTARVLQLQREDCPPSPLCTIVELCLALWGKLDYSFEENDDTRPEYVEARARVEALSQWVERVSSASVRKEVENFLEGDDSEESYLDAVFSYITAREMGQACNLLQQNGDHSLALLLAQCCMGDEVPRQILSKQLSNWSECGADSTMSPSRLMLYALVAGRATHTSSSGLINICKGLDWRRALALHLWFICPATCTISEALEAYEKGAGLIKDSSTSPPYCLEPLPQYLASHTIPDSTSRVSYDTCYHLLKLFVNPSYRLDQLLNPVTNTPDPLDVTNSWIVLVLMQSLGYTHVKPLVANSLHLSMASYLESVGLWHWAIFVLLFLKDEKSRGYEVREVLSRHVQVQEGIELDDDTFVKMAQQKQRAGEITDGDGMETQDDEDVGFVDGEEHSMDATDAFDQTESRRNVDIDSDMEEDSPELSNYEKQEKFLVKKLKIPEQWINECKAVLARSLGMVEAEAWYLIRAGDLKAAHSLLIKTIAPNAIINEDHDYLKSFITAFEASSSTLIVNVPEWKVGGGVYAHYLHVLSAVEEIKVSQQPTQSKVEALRPRLLALCSQLNSLDTPTSKHRLAVSEISRVVVGVLRAVLGEDLSATTAIATQVSQLPLSRDCALQELNTLTHQYLTGIAN